VSSRLFERTARGSVIEPASRAPGFELDRSWPHVPAKWKLGFISSVCVDAQDHVWVLHRPRTLPEADAAAAAPVRVRSVREPRPGLGGPTRLLVAEREHSICRLQGQRLDQRNNYPARQDRGLKRVSDDQLLKFTRTGTLLVAGAQPEPRQRRRPTSTSRPMSPSAKTSKAFVADGYGNHRVIVLDADTGVQTDVGRLREHTDRHAARGPEIPPPSIPTMAAPGPAIRHRARFASRTTLATSPIGKINACR
jgi:hypothetical protein